MNSTERMKHDAAMAELEKKVDSSIIKVIMATRPIAARLNSDSEASVPIPREWLQNLQDALKEADQIRLEWLEEARKVWHKS